MYQNLYYKNGYITESNLHIQQNSIKIQMTFYTEPDKQSHMETQKTLKLPRNYKEEEKHADGTTVTNLKLYQTAIVTKIK